MQPNPQSDQLPLFRSAPITPDVGELGRILEERRGWLKAAEIERLTGWSDRIIRELAASSGGRILSGQRGYRHLSHASVEEIDHAANWLESQAAHMQERAIALRRAAIRVSAGAESAIRNPQSAMA